MLMPSASSPTTITIDLDLSPSAIAPLIESWGPRVETAISKIEVRESGHLLLPVEDNGYLGQFEQDGLPTQAFLKHAARLSPAQCLVLMWTADQASPHTVARSLPEAVMMSALDRADNTRILAERFEVFHEEGVLRQLFDTERIQVLEKVLAILRDSTD